MERVDVTIIGAGVIGLAASYLLSGSEKDILAIDKNPSFGQETSSRNSEVIHAGLYYPKDSFKARTCIRGKKLLYDLCSKHNIPHKRLGKLVVASGKEGIAKINEIYDNAKECGVNDLKLLDRDEIKKMEPAISAEKALFSPTTGIIDSHSLMKFFFEAAKERKVGFSFSVEAIAAEKKGDFYEISVREPSGDPFSFKTKFVINSGGLWSDRVASFVIKDAEKIHYCKGQYFRVRNPKKFGISHLVYPPPSETDLGIHLTPDLAGGLRLGPDTRYVPDIDYNINEKDKNAFLNSAKEYLPTLEADDIIPDTVGVRSKLQAEGGAFRDFIIRDEKEKGFPGFINLIGIESPGLTGALAIAEVACSNIH